jgi:hypothetical protein
MPWFCTDWEINWQAIAAVATSIAASIALFNQNLKEKLFRPKISVEIGTVGLFSVIEGTNSYVKHLKIKNLGALAKKVSVFCDAIEVQGIKHEFPKVRFKWPYEGMEKVDESPRDIYDFDHCDLCRVSSNKKLRLLLTHVPSSVGPKIVLGAGVPNELVMYVSVVGENFAPTKATKIRIKYDGNYVEGDSQKMDESLRITIDLS